MCLNRHRKEIIVAIGRRISPSRLILLLVVFAAAAGGCGSSAEPRDPIDAGDLRAEAALLAETVTGHVAAWMKHDPEEIRSYWDAETVHEDTGFLVELTGPQLFTMPDGFFDGYPDFQWTVDQVFVADGVALAATSAWAIDLRDFSFSEAVPLREIDRIEVDPDGTLGRWTLFYDLDAYREWHALDSRLDEAESLVRSYADAWGSGDPKQVIALYAPDARRVDSLFGVDLEGADAIEAHAERFSSWYPDAALTDRLIFSDTRLGFEEPERIGAVLTMHGAGADGSDCAVDMAVILSSSEGSIVHEEVFWDADSLLACGWAA